MNESVESIDTSDYIPYVLVNEEWVPLDDCEFINVEEDIVGRDVVTFLYNKETYKSFTILAPPNFVTETESAE